MAQRKNDYIHWTDSLFVPASIVLSFILSRWIPWPWAPVLSFVIVSFVLFLFEPREENPKRFIFPMLLGAVVIFLLTLFHWPS